MATIIDALLVTLGLDASKFKQEHKASQEAMKKIGEEAKKQHAEMQSGVKMLTESYRGLVSTVATLTGVALGADFFRQFVGNITRSDAATGRFATNIAVATQELSAWQNAAKRFGGSAEDIAGGFRTINEMVQNLRNNGWDERILPLQRAGLDTGRFFAASTDNVERMRMLVQLFGRLSAQDAQFWGAQAGFTEGAINALREMSPELDAVLKKQRDLNAASEKDKQLAIERQKAWADLTDTLEGFGRTALNVVSAFMVGVTKTGAQQSKKGLLEQAWDLLTGKTTLDATKSGWQSLRSYMGDSEPEERRSSGTVTTIPAGAATPAPGDKNAAALMSSLERQYGLPAGLLDAVWAQESARGKHMLSSAGAKGHFQFMPRTAEEYGISGREHEFGASADAAARKYRDLLKRYGGDLNKALAAYNAGDRRVMAGGPLPPETIRYVEQVRGRMGGGGSSVQIDSVNVYSNSRDGNGLARDFVHGTQRELSLATQSDSGLN